MKIGLLQCNLRYNDIDGNAEVILEAVRKAAARGAELCVTSELALCGVPATDMLLRSAFVQHCKDKINNMAVILQQENLPPLLLGAPVANPVPQGKPVHNCAVLLRNGKSMVISRKVLLAADGTHDDHLYFESGVACGVLHLNGWRFAVTLGEDVWNDKGFWQGRRRFEIDPVAELMAGGADALINLTGIPFYIGGQDLHRKMLTWTSSKFRVPVISVNQVGGMDASIYPGASMVFNSSGVLVQQAEMFKEEVLVADLVGNTDATKKATKLEEAEELWSALVLGVRDFAVKCGFSQAVLGLSGGIDSALVAVLAVEALGKENVLGVLMPSPYSSSGSVDDSLKLAKNLDIETMLLPISHAMDAYKATFATVFSGLAEDTTEENIQPRIRSNFLMALSNKFGRILLNTGNKTESAVGYSTIYGDATGAIAVIGDLYKNQVYTLSKWINHKQGRAVIPEEIINKEPSAELKPDQKDSDSLPPYDLLDAILYAYIEDEQDINGLLGLGFEQKTVERVLTMLERSEFKRRQAPSALYVTTHGFGQGGKMPVASKKR